MNTAEATRQIYWNISHIWVMYALLLPTAAIAGYGIYRHTNRWRRGQPTPRFDRPADRLKLVLKHAVAQRRTARHAFAGSFHRLITYALFTLTVSTPGGRLDACFVTAVMRARF